MFASSSLPYSCSSLSNPFIITYQAFLQLNGHFYSLMELTNITYLDQLEVSKDNYNLKVRIIKLWRQLEMGNVEETRAIHMILMDEKGIKIQATVSTSYDATTLFINDEIDEITDFKNKLLDKEGIENSTSHRLSTSSRFINLQDDFLTITTFNNIAEVNEIYEVKSVIIIGTIKWVSHDTDWYYYACNTCNKKVTKKYMFTDATDGSGHVEEKQTFECNNDKCTAPVISAVPRFIIPLRVQDGTGVLSLTLFDKEANKKFNKSAYELLQNTLEGHNKKDYPDVFDDLLEQKMAFKIDITNYNLQCMNTANRSYTISRMTEDSTIISTLEKKHRIED
ncbi:hypothetical protein L1987_30118 [Smallanthus sonchifolius]|uniref:Uncharacterized protein n=1 Tax=Smallanthus sonchifolius TaxID=185202 RepID=A0ACB9I1S1_9ASTR|nr:hypothetical protein L1987_30118 [Smallanthus sonchifolius]